MLSNSALMLAFLRPCWGAKGFFVLPGAALEACPWLPSNTPNDVAKTGRIPIGYSIEMTREQLSHQHQEYETGSRRKISERGTDKQHQGGEIVGKRKEKTHNSGGKGNV